MTAQPRKPDLSETSPMDPAAAPPPSHPPHTAAGDNGNFNNPPLDAPPTPEGEGEGRERKGNTNIDTIIGRLVVDQGLATSEEVQSVFELVRSAQDPNQASLSHKLVSSEVITKRQLERLRQMAEAERSGQQIPGYKILGKLGAGAMATVYKAKQLSLDRTVAIKVLPKKFTGSASFIERFYAEGRAAALLNHPNIVGAFDVGKAGEYHYFVMEYVDGRTVYDDIVKHKKYAEAESLDIVMQIAEALMHAHSKGLIHRDVKPKNIMITREGVAKLADMGLARAISDKEAAEAEQGKAFGTPYYISPEQIRGEVNIGPPADIYSLGATLYHMVTGAVPYEGKNPSAVMHKHLKSELVPPDHVNQRLSAGISEVIEMMMAKDPKARYQNCKDLLVDLKAVRERKNPPIAHKDFAVDEVKGLLAAEAAAPAMLREDQSAGPAARSTIWTWPFITLLVLLVISVLVNVILALNFNP
ncbi:MAG: serine/threonine protein kinase [Phycisphaerales bacterium]